MYVSRNVSNLESRGSRSCSVPFGTNHDGIETSNECVTAEHSEHRKESKTKFKNTIVYHLNRLCRRRTSGTAFSKLKTSSACCGLQNIGNTCFMNSALQCLVSVPDLSEWAIQARPRLSHVDIIDVFISLVQSMWSGQLTSAHPGELKDSLSTSAPIFSGYGQKDAHEFMNSLLNAMESANSTAFPGSLFRIHTASTVTCSKSEHSDTTNETTSFLSLPIPRKESHDRKKVSLDGLIQDFCQEEEMNGDYYCQQCGEYQSARQKTSICDPLPRALIIQLKRFPFDGTNRKIDTLVNYKLEYQHLLSAGDQYRLSAVLIHHGTLGGGHYITRARNYRNGQWYEFDDSRVSQIKAKDISSLVVTRQAYVLVYIKENQSVPTSSQSA